MSSNNPDKKKENPIVRDKFGNIIEVSPNQRITYVHESHFAPSSKPVVIDTSDNEITDDNTVTTNDDYKVKRKVNKTSSNKN